MSFSIDISINLHFILHTPFILLEHLLIKYLKKHQYVIKELNVEEFFIMILCPRNIFAISLLKSTKRDENKKKSIIVK